ncbi:MAG TPA: PIN domain-containing protein [Nitrospirota bacterium]|nr:PIN domain-containing protein [Nitrospirota bacterium]
MQIVTDTHPWVWFLTANPRLSSKARESLADPSNLIIVPSIVLMEIRYLYQHKRIPLSFEVTLQQVETCSNILIAPLDISVVTISPISLDIHDAIIVGTALQAAEEFGQTTSLVTIDGAITDSRLVPIIW